MWVRVPPGVPDFMTRERAKELLPIIKAFSEGKIIQYEKDCKWVDCFYQTDISFEHSSTSYRIKPEAETESSSYCCGGECGCTGSD
jgi:hypothetical protein